MNDSADDDTKSSPSKPNASSTHKLRTRELIYAAIGVVSGFVVLPLLIFIVGTILLGLYAGGKSIGIFFAEFYGNLGRGAARTWFIVLAPYLAIWLVRLSFRSYAFRNSAKSPPPPSLVDPVPTQPKQTPSRREPFISS